MNLAIQTFVSPFQGCFKDGTNGTRDYRALSGGILAALLLMSLFSVCFGIWIETNARDPVMSLQFVIVMFITVSVGFAVFKPYKADIANHTAVTLSALCAVFNTLYIFLFRKTTHSYVTVSLLAVITSIPHFVFYGYLVYRIRQCDFKRRLQEWCCCYRQSENVPLLRQD